MNWIESLLLGSFGIAVATIALALVGFALLSGRLSIRTGGRVLIGCFILFGAPAIAKGLLDIARGSQSSYVAPPIPASIPIPNPPKPPPPNPDPYAGASVPM